MSFCLKDETEKFISSLLSQISKAVERVNFFGDGFVNRQSLSHEDKHEEPKENHLYSIKAQTSRYFQEPLEFKRNQTSAVVSAIRHLDDHKGSTEKSIRQLLCQEGDMLQDDDTIKELAANLRLALRKATKAGAITKTHGNRYKLPPRTSSRQLASKDKCKKQKKKKESKCRAKKVITPTRKIKIKSSQTKAKCKSGRKGSGGRRLNVNKVQDGSGDGDWLKKKVVSWSLPEMLESVASPSPILEVCMGGKRVMALLDTGAVLSIMCPVTFERLGLPLVRREEAPLLKYIKPRAANNAEIPILGMTACDVNVAGQVIRRCFFVVMRDRRHPPPVIVGMNVLRCLRGDWMAKVMPHAKIPIGDDPEEGKGCDMGSTGPEPDDNDDEE